MVLVTMWVASVSQDVPAGWFVCSIIFVTIILIVQLINDKFNFALIFYKSVGANSKDKRFFALIDSTLKDRSRTLL